MPLLSPTEFGKLIGKSRVWVHQYAERGKIFLTGDKIDTDYIVNKHFLEKWSGNTTSKSHNPSGRPKSKPKPEPTGPDENTTNLYLMDAELKQLELRKKSADAQLAEEKLKKVRGETVPTELVKPVFERYSRACLTAFKNAAENAVHEMVKRYGLSREDAAREKTRMILITNEAVEDAYRNAVDEVQAIVEEYSQKRGIGERV